MKPPYAILFASCTDAAATAVRERLAVHFEVNVSSIATEACLRQELTARTWDAIFLTSRSALTPSLVLRECEVARTRTPVFVLCDADTENDALDAMRAGASDAIRIDDLRRLLPAVARARREGIDRRAGLPLQNDSSAPRGGQHFRELFELSSDAIVIFESRVNGVWRCDAMNPAFEHLTGLRSGDCAGRTPCEMLSTVPETLAQAFRNSETTAEVSNREHPFDLPTGQRWFNTVVVPLTLEDGRVCRIACMARDITDHWLTIDRLRESEQRRMLHIQHTPLGAIEWSYEGRVVSWNPAAENIFGYRAKEAIGRHLNLIIPVDVRPHVDGIWAALLAQRGGCRSTNRNVRKDGVFIECEWYNTPLIDDTGKTIGVASLVQDVTELRQNEEAIRRLNAELESRVAERTSQLAAANKELESFSYSVSHDLRAPLRSIDGFSKALLEDCFDQLGREGQDYLLRVRAATQRMGELIDDLLNLSRVNRAELKRTTVDLSAIARKVADGLRTAHPERQVEWAIDSPLIMDGDKNLLTILMENLLDNAFKYTSRRPSARIELKRFDDKGRFVYCVKDDGVGFDMAYAEKLFHPFQRLHRPDEFDGHGIGLATAQRIVQRHHGHIWAEGATDVGACFFFTMDDPPLPGDDSLE